MSRFIIYDTQVCTKKAKNNKNEKEEMSKIRMQVRAMHVNLSSALSSERGGRLKHVRAHATRTKGDVAAYG